MISDIKINLQKRYLRVWTIIILLKIESSKCFSQHSNKTSAHISQGIYCLTGWLLDSEQDRAISKKWAI
jgi:hypothetical protein